MTVTLYKTLFETQKKNAFSSFRFFIVGCSQLSGIFLKNESWIFEESVRKKMKTVAKIFQNVMVRFSKKKERKKFNLFNLKNVKRGRVYGKYASFWSYNLIKTFTYLLLKFWFSVSYYFDFFFRIIMYMFTNKNAQLYLREYWLFIQSS